MSLEKWQEIADSGSQAKLELEPGLSWAADLGVLEFNGVEAAKFLQGYLTCDTEGLPVDQWQPTALCNLKGRVVANGWVSADAAGSLWLLVHQSLAETCLAFLHKYLVFAKAEGHNRSGDLVVIMGFQQTVPDNLNAQTLATKTTPGADSDTWLSLASLAQAIELWQQAQRLTPNTQFNTALLTAGLALVTSHSSEQYLPQMLGLAASGAIDFDKGCYLGQEIVARAQHRGAVKRQLALLRWEQSATTSNRWEAGELTDDNNAPLGKIINGLVAPDSSSALIGRAVAVISIKGESFPAQARGSATANTNATESQNNVTPNSKEPIYFQVSKIEN